MLVIRKKLFNKAVNESVSGIYKMTVEKNVLLFTAVNTIPSIKEFIDDSLNIRISGKYFGLFFTKDFDSDIMFSNPAVLCEDGNYYIFNEYRYIPEYVYPVKNDYLSEYPKTLEDCMEVQVKC